MKVYNISFTFDQPQPGVITIPADSADEANSALLKMLEGFSNVVIHSTVDLEEVPFLKHMYDQQQKQQQSSLIIDADFEEVSQEDNVIEFTGRSSDTTKKPN